jgi:hypothetical protein
MSRAELEIQKAIDDIFLAAGKGQPLPDRMPLEIVRKMMSIAFDHGYNAAVDDAVAIVEGRAANVESLRKT